MFRNRGFTDKLYFLNLTLSWLFIIVCIVMTALEGRLGITDLSIASVGIPAVFAELGVHTGFIVWKAKTENISKFGINPETYVSGQWVPAEETTDDNNIIYNNADDRSGCNITPDRSNKESVHKRRKGIFR